MTALPNGQSDSETTRQSFIETPYLIVGAGPAGASLACFLSQYDLKGIMISAAPGTAKEPRAHITNPAAQECLRDVGLEDEVLRNATVKNNMAHTRWCYAMAGEEFGRIHSWGNQPDRRGDYAAASPCQHVDLPQTLLEPILVKRAIDQGWKVRFDSTILKFDRPSPTGPITSTIRDRVTGATYHIRSKYLFGCDGGRSHIMRQLDIPLIKAPGQGLAINVLVEADLTNHMQHRTGNLHWVFQPDRDPPAWGWTCLARMVKPWHEWMFIFLPRPGFADLAIQPTEDEYLQRSREVIGDDSIPLKVLDVAKWYINEIVAERYSDGNIYCLGDAVHRHPPINGLGSNTCIQDAYNLAWKVAYVESGLADPQLLESYSLERQPIGAGIVQRANQGLRDHVPVWEALGVLPLDVEERKRQFAELSAASLEGRDRRRKLREGIAYTTHEFGAIGIEMNQEYRSCAIYSEDEKEARRPLPDDPVLQYQITTYPGARLPHAWLNTRFPKDQVSTIDLAGHGAFCLFTGPGGDEWKAAAQSASKQLGVPVSAYSIGWLQDWEDVYGEWAKKRDIEEDGCVLCRPDRAICWRSTEMRENATEVLVKVLNSVLRR